MSAVAAFKERANATHAMPSLAAYEALVEDMLGYIARPAATDWTAWCHEVECVANGLGLHDAGEADQWCTMLGPKIAERCIDREDEAYAAGRATAGLDEALTEITDLVADFGEGDDYWRDPMTADYGVEIVVSRRLVWALQDSSPLGHGTPVPEEATLPSGDARVAAG